MSDMEYLKKPSEFTWDGLGDIALGRESLGNSMPVLVYRLFQYTLRDILNREVGGEKAAALYRAAGNLAGMEFAKNVLDLTGDIDHFISNLQRTLFDLKVGILNIEKADLETLQLVLTVSEDLDCSGLPIVGETVCDYDEGFIAGILEVYTGKVFDVKEIDCWATGDRTCRFTAKPV